MVELGDFLKADEKEWKNTKIKAFEKNGWFTLDFIELAIKNIVDLLLDNSKLNEWANYYHLDDNIDQKNIGIVMAGNIPLVGFHDFLSVFISGHKQSIKLSSKDNVLLDKVIGFLVSKNRSLSNYFNIEDRLSGCDAYITTGSNNTSRYFEYYFGKYPSIIRKNKTSVAILNGNESLAELEKLADDVCLYFGLGCRNVTKLFVPLNYDFENFLNSFKKYKYFSDHKKYRNNFDYYTTLQIMNNHYYMTNEVILLIENESLFSPVSQVNYSFYDDLEKVKNSVSNDKNIQCITGREYLSFGGTQEPGLFDYADKIDTMQFLLAL